MEKQSSRPFTSKLRTMSVSPDNNIVQHFYPSHGDESSISYIFDSEVDQMLGPHLLDHYRTIPGISLERQHAVNWILKVHAHYHFQPVTAYLAVTYLDRFLASHTFPGSKGWAFQLLSVACLSLAAKMVETCIPTLLDLQVCELKLWFKPKTIQRMELLVMANLKWRLLAITPFDFLHYLITKLPRTLHDNDQLANLISRVSDLLISTCRVMEFLDHRPSVIAATAFLMVTGKSVHDLKLGCFEKRVSRDMDRVKRCHHLLKQNKYQWEHI